MKKVLSFIFCLSLFFSFSQSSEQIDSLTVVMCKTLIDNKTNDAESKIKLLTENHFVPFLEKIKDMKQKEEVYNKIYYRLQKDCNEFTLLLSETTKNKSDWEVKQDKPTINLTDKQYKAFSANKHLYYKEYEGTYVNVELKNGYWIETFEDNTFSKLKYIKKDNGSFELEFIESNNLSRKNLSRKSDLYKYQLFGEKDNIFNVYMENNGTYYLFKLYPTVE